MQLVRLWIVTIAALAIAAVIDMRDQQLEFNGYNRRERLYTCILIIVLGFFCGLRTWGNDTVTYIQVYNQLPPMEEFLQHNDFGFADGIGFIYLTCFLKDIGFTCQDYLMFYAFVTAALYVQFVRRFSTNILWGVLLMFTTGFYTFSLAAIKQALAVGICACALPLALDKKWVKFSLAIGLASLAHPFALIYLIVPFMMFEPWQEKTIICVIAFVAAGFMLERLMGTVLDITAMMGADYTTEEMMGQGVNILRVAVCLVPMLIAVFYGGDLFRNAGKDVYLMFNLAMVNGLIMFVGIFGTANYFARLANYFLPAQVAIIPWILHSAHPKDRRWLMPTCIIGYLGFYMVENAVIRPFDTGYTQMSVWKYLATFFTPGAR